MSGMIQSLQYLGLLNLELVDFALLLMALVDISKNERLAGVVIRFKEARSHHINRLCLNTPTGCYL